MNVLLLTGGFPSIDNPTKSIFNLRTALSLSQKIDLTVVHFRYWKPNRKIKEPITYKGLNVIQLSLPWIPIENSFINSLNILFWKYLCKYLLKKETKKVDVIHSVGIDGMASIGSFLSEKKIKHISQTIGSDLNFHWEKLKKYYFSKGWEKNVDVFLCNSEALEKKINIEFPKNKSKTIYRGTDLKKFQPNRNRKRSNKIKVLFIGGFANRKSTAFGKNLKGGESLKKIWSKIEEIIGNSRVEGELFLGGPNSSESELREWIECLKYKSKVHCLGLIPVDQIPELMQQVDIVVIPSMAEGLPNVAVEALACEKLVIASNVGGIPEVIIDQKTGLLFDAGNTFEFEKLLLNAIINFDKTKDIRNNTRIWVEKYFDSSEYANKIIKLYLKE